MSTSGRIGLRTQLRQNYMGTEVDGKWWRSYRANGFFTKGNGTYAWTDDALVYRRALTHSEWRIPIASLSGVSTGRWHGGTWGGGHTIVKIEWQGPNAQQLTTGILITPKEAAAEFVAQVRARTGSAQSS